MTRLRSWSLARRGSRDVHGACEFSTDWTIEFSLNSGRQRRQSVEALDVIDCGDQQSLTQEGIVNPLRVVGIRLVVFAAESCVEFGALGGGDDDIGGTPFCRAILLERRE